MKKPKIKYPYLGLDTKEDLEKSFATLSSIPELEGTVLDPNRHYVEKHLKEAVLHLRKQEIAPETIVDALGRELLGFLKADLQRKRIDLKMAYADIMLLSHTQNKINYMLNQRVQALKDADINDKDLIIVDSGNYEPVIWPDPPPRPSPVVFIGSIFTKLMAKPPTK